MIAARVAAEFKSDRDVQVELVKGGLGELSVSIDSRKEIDTIGFCTLAPARS